MLAKTKFKIPKIKSRGTSPADRSLRVQAMNGSGLMARDTILCTPMTSQCFIDRMLQFRSSLSGSGDVPDIYNGHLVLDSKSADDLLGKLVAILAKKL